VQPVVNPGPAARFEDQITEVGLHDFFSFRKRLIFSLPYYFVDLFCPFFIFDVPYSNQLHHARLQQSPVQYTSALYGRELKLFCYIPWEVASPIRTKAKVKYW
jgi:hypothetical protein